MHRFNFTLAFCPLAFCPLALCSLAIGNVVIAGEALPDCDVTEVNTYSDNTVDIVVCAEALAATSSLQESGDYELINRQPLKRCGPDDKRPRLFLTIKPLAANQHENLKLVNDEQAVCSLSLASLSFPATPAWINTMQDADARTIEIDGISTRYYEYGQGRPLVLVHGGQAGGFNNSALKWEQNIPGLSRHFRVIALDRLGQGHTDNPADYQTYYADDAIHLQRFIEELGLTDVVLVGHSQGGWPVTRVALNKPDTVSCVVNVDTVMVPDDMELMGPALAFLMYQSRFLHAASGPTQYSARRGMQLRYPTGQNITVEKAERVVELFELNKTTEAAAGMRAVRMTPLNPAFKDLKEQAFTDIQNGQLKTKSVIIWGELDPQVPIGLGLQFNGMLDTVGADNNWLVMEGAGHAPFIEFPDAFNQLVLTACAQN